MAADFTLVTFLHDATAWATVISRVDPLAITPRTNWRHVLTLRRSSPFVPEPWLDLCIRLLRSVANLARPRRATDLFMGITSHEPYCKFRGSILPYTLSDLLELEIRREGWYWRRRAASTDSRLSPLRSPFRKM